MKEIKAYIPNDSNGEIVFLREADCKLHEATVQYGSELLESLKKYESILKELAEKDKIKDPHLAKFRTEKAMMKWVIQNRVLLAQILNNPEYKDI